MQRKHTRESTRAGTAKARANKCRTFNHKGPAQAPHAVTGARYLPTQAGWQTNKQRQDTRRQVHSTCKQGGHAVQPPSQAKCDLLEWWMMARTSAVWPSSRDLWPKTSSCSRTSQAHNLFSRPWLQNMLACTIFN